MSKKRFIDTSFWADVWVVDELTRDERHFFLYLLTNDKTSIAGVYELSMKMMAFESDFSRDEITAMFKKLEAKVRYVDGWVVMRNGIKNQNYRNEKIKRGIEIVLEHCPGKCLDYIDFPKDFNFKPVDKPQQQRLLDESSMSHGESLHSDSDSDSDSDLDPEPKASPHPTGTNSPGSNKLDKKSYAKAVQADKDLEVRAIGASERKTNKGYKAARSIAEEIKERKAKKK